MLFKLVIPRLADTTDAVFVAFFHPCHRLLHSHLRYYRAAQRAALDKNVCGHIT